MLNGVDLFSGGGWCSEGLAEWVRPIAYCEIDEFSQRVLLSRQYRGEIPRAPIWDDVRTLRGGMLPLPVDILYGGFPCQGHSLAGRRKRMADSRSQLFWEIVRLAEETKAPFLFLENVWPGIRRSIPTIRAALESLGYSVRDGHLSASDVGLPHRRERWFCLAYSHAYGQRKLQSQGPIEIVGGRSFHLVERPIAADTLCERGRLQSGRGSRARRAQTLHTLDDVAQGTNSNSLRERLSRSRFEIGIEPQQSALASALERDDWHAIAAFFCGMDHGKPYRGKRIGVLGNSVPWIQYREAFVRLMGLKHYGGGCE